MAHFRFTAQGSRGEASRLGGPKKGGKVTANGWKAGVSVYASSDEATGRDKFHVYMTAGSGGGTQEQLIGVVTVGEDGKPIIEETRSE